MHEQRPTVGADQEWNRNSPSMRGEEWRALAIEHWVIRATAIELICAFAEPQHRRVSLEFDGTIRALLENQLLNEFSICAANRDCEWLRGHDHLKFSGANLLFSVQFTRAKSLHNWKRSENCRRS